MGGRRVQIRQHCNWYLVLGCTRDVNGRFTVAYTMFRCCIKPVNQIQVPASTGSRMNGLDLYDIYRQAYIGLRA